MSVTGFNRRRREMAAQQAAEEAARLELHRQEQEEAEEAARLETQKQEDDEQEPTQEPEAPDEQYLAEELEAAPGDLDDMPYPELRALAKERGIEGYYNMNTEELRAALKEGE